MSTLRIGVNLHPKARAGQERSAAEKIYLPQFLRQLNPSAIVVMDDFPLAQDLHSALPQTIVIYRQYNPAEGHMWKVISPEQYFANQRGISKPGMPLYVLNEPDSKMPIDDLRASINWLVRVMDIYASAGLSICAHNLGAGHPDYSWFTDNVKWAAVKPLFDAMRRYPMHFWALHPYWGQLGLRPEDGQSARHREIERLLKARGYDMPPVLFTETGRDKYGDSNTSGWRSTGITEEAYAAEIVTARNTLWTESYIRGATVFCYGSTTEQWRSFDIEDAKILHTALIGANQSAPPQQPPKPDPIPPILHPPEPSQAEKDIRRLAEIDSQILALEVEMHNILARWKPVSNATKVA